EHEIALPMAGHLPGISLGRSLTDGHHVPDLAASVRTLLSARPPDRTLAPEKMEHAGVKHFPRRHIQVTIDRFVGDPHRRVTAKIPPQPLGDLLWCRVVAVLVSATIPHPNAVGALARFRSPRPLERGRVGDQCPVRIAATIAGN